MTQTDKSWWEARSKGRVWFIFREGILHNGTRGAFWFILLLALVQLIVSLVQLISTGRIRLPKISDGTFAGLITDSLQFVLGLAIGWAFLAVCIGTLVGFILWNRHEKDYQTRKGADDSSRVVARD
jgi:hypothetical protein